jgi:hypothetical protein
VVKCPDQANRTVELAFTARVAVKDARRVYLITCRTRELILIEFPAQGLQRQLLSRLWQSSRRAEPRNVSEPAFPVPRADL